MSWVRGPVRAASGSVGPPKLDVQDSPRLCQLVDSMSGAVLKVAEAARAMPPSPAPRRTDLLLDGFALMITEGHSARLGLEARSRALVSKEEVAEPLDRSSPSWGSAPAETSLGPPRRWPGGRAGLSGPA